MFRLLPGIALAFALCGCSGRQPDSGSTVALSDLPPVHIPAGMDSVAGINRWLATGPFEFNPLLIDPVKTFFRKDLKRYGIREGTADPAGIEKLQRQGVDVFLIDRLSPQVKLFSYILKNVHKKSNFYLISRIHSGDNQDAALIIDGSNSYAAWLNGEKLVEVRGKYNTSKAGDRFVNVSLKKGENTLFVKVNRGANIRSWDLSCFVAPRQEAERIFRVNYAGDFAVNPVVTNALEVYAGPYGSGNVEITDHDGLTVASGSFNNCNTNVRPVAVSGLGRLKDGFYKAVLTVGNRRLEEMIYKGDYRKFVKKMRKSVDKINDGIPYAADLKAAMQRVDFLNGKPGDAGSSSETRFLNRNRVFWGYSLDRMLHKDARTQFMAYGHPDGGSPGVFIFHKSGKLTDNIPLVIIVPSALQGASMIEDWYAGNLDQIETDNALADEYGFATAWIYAGGRNYTADQTEKEITAVLNRLHPEYGIDSKKTVILGDCEGGRRALIQLARSPGRYAACAAEAPVAFSCGDDESPAGLLSRMGNVPVMIRHGRDDEVSPVEDSRALYAESQKANMPVEYVETGGGHASLSKDNHRAVFDFFSRIISSVPLK